MQSVFYKQIDALGKSRCPGVFTCQLVDQGPATIHVVGTYSILKALPYAFDGMQFNFVDDLVEVVHSLAFIPGIRSQ